MPLRLRVIPPASGPDGGSPIAEHSIDFEDGVGQIRIGRRAGLEMSLPYSALSGVHARLVKAGDPKPDHWVLEDLGSTNGTYVEGERLKPGIKRPLTTGTQIKLAEVQLIFDGDVQRAAPVPVSTKHTDRTRVLAEEGEPKSAHPKSGPTRTDQKVADAKAAEAKLMAAKLAADAMLAEAKLAAEAKMAADAKLAAAKLAAEARLAEAKALDAKAAESKSAKKAPDPTETYVRPQSSDLFSPSPIAPAVPYLKAVSGGSSGDTFRLELRDHEYLFGRTARCEFRVKTNEVSREHASFTRRTDGVYVNDLGSVNGVLVNNTRVREFRLYDGDLIQLGHIKLRLFDPTEGAPRRPAHGPGHIPPPGEARAYAPHEATGTGSPQTYAPPPARSEASAVQSDLHPAIAGHLAAEGIRPRRQSVRIRFTENWESSSKFRYAIVIICAAVLAAAAVIGGFALASS
jgi:pSer/pThr/pTyr-binding forkhead associated (FHA) protein